MLKNKLKLAKQEKTTKRKKQPAVVTRLVNTVTRGVPESVIKSIEEQAYQEALALIPKELHRRFIEEYIILPNGTQAAIKAGYPEKNASHQASELLGKPHILNCVELGFLSVRASKTVTRERIEEELAKIAFGSVGNALTFDQHGVYFKNSEELDQSILAGISEVSSTQTKHGTSMKMRMHDKNTSLVALARMHGLDKGGMGREKSANPIDELMEAIQQDDATKLTVKP